MKYFVLFAIIVFILFVCVLNNTQKMVLLKNSVIDNEDDEIYNYHFNNYININRK